MIRGTTPILQLEVDGYNLKLLEELYVTIKQGDIFIEKELTDIHFIDEHTIKVTLTQEETLLLKAYDDYSRPLTCQIQVRGAIGPQFAIASDIVKIDVKEILKEGVIGE